VIRGLSVLAFFVGALLIPGPPAFAAASDDKPVALIVGLRGDGDVTKNLDKTVDVLSSESLTGALTVDVPADQVTVATEVLRADPAVKYVEVDHIAHASTVDPGFEGQWGITKTGVDHAWASVRGSGVTVAVVDTGVTAMPDLAGRLLPGYDFVNGDTDPGDDSGHGTMTAGVIAAAGDNGVGIAGICWLCRILPVKVLDAGGSGSYSAIAEGIRYAADQGADIINLSLGGTSDSQLLRDAVAYAAGKGSLVIAAAGNDGNSTPHFPAAIPAVLAVGGSTSGDARYPWSNYGGSWIDIAAPGCNPAQGVNGLVSQFCGTSSATPFVSGVAALLAGTAPTPDSATVRAALTSSAVPLAGNWVAAGSGRVDAAAALDALPFWVTGVRSGAYVGAGVTVTPHIGTGAGITRVTAALDGVTVDTATSAPWTLDLDTSTVTGTAKITIIAYAGSTQRSTATFPVVADHARPAVAFRSPGPLALARSVLSVTAAASDDVALSRVQLLAGSQVLGTDTAAPYAFRWQSAPRNGAVTLTLRAYDRAGNATTTKRTFVVDNWAPTVVVTDAPANGTRRVRKTQYLTAQAADQHGIARMELVVNGKIMQRYAGPRHTFSVQTWKHGDAMTVQVRAYDRAGNVRFAPARKWYR
jgi:subtilisin family serine protease